MPEKKRNSITESMRVFYTPLSGDKEALAYFETKLLQLNNMKDCLELKDAEIIRYCVHLAYQLDKDKKHVVEFYNPDRRGKKKKCSITETKRVFYTPLERDKKVLAHFEMKLMELNGRHDCLDVTDAEIIRYCISLAYRLDKGGRK